MELEDAVVVVGQEKKDDEPKQLQPMWENEPTVEDLKGDLFEAQSDHDTQTTKIDGYLDKLYVQNGEKLPKSKTHSTIQPKLIQKNAEWRYAALSEPFLSTPDIFNIDPKSPDDKFAAIQNEKVLNNQFNTQIDKVKFIDDYTHTAVDEGTAIVRVGWEFEEEPELTIGIDPMTGMQIRVEIMKTTKNQPTVEVCNYNNVIIDPTCEGDIDKAQFVIYSFVTIRQYCSCSIIFSSNH